MSTRKNEPATPSGRDANCGLTYAQLEVACANVGVDITCPDCAMQFFTGFTGPTSRYDFIPQGHWHECKTGKGTEGELVRTDEPLMADGKDKP